MRLFLGVMAAAGLLALAANVASAADEWSHYVDKAFGFSCDKPDAMVFETGTGETAQGPAEHVVGMLYLGARGSIGVQVSRHIGALPQDDDTVLDGIARGMTSKPGSVVDSITPVVINGAPGREVQWHTAEAAFRARLLLGRKSGERLFMIVGTGKTSVPSEFERLEASFVPVP